MFLTMKKPLLLFSYSFILFNFSTAQPNIQWQKSYGGTLDDFGSTPYQSSDGGYVRFGLEHASNF
jgi:hypothetical protein